MTKSFNDFLSQYPTVVIPEHNVIYYAYSKGLVQEFKTREEASTHSRNIERVVTNKQEINDAHTLWNARISNAMQDWYNYLKTNYNPKGIDVEIFDMCFEDAKLRSDSEIVEFDKLEESIKFAQKMIEFAWSKYKVGL